jgi:hypothetical protein
MMLMMMMMMTIMMIMMIDDDDDDDDDDVTNYTLWGPRNHIDNPKIHSLTPRITRSYPRSTQFRVMFDPTSSTNHNLRMVKIN